jgi:peptidoglycan/xylan/chitin deacetylase (PgdA/CDA1 family)
MAFLARHRNVLPLDRFVEALKEGEPLPAGSVAITFDDGYLDNLTEAFPILSEFGLSATVFLPSRNIDEQEPPWINRLYSAIVHRRRSQLSISHGVNFTGSLQTAADCDRAYLELSRELVSLDYEPRKLVLNEISRQLDSKRIPIPLGMGWSDVRESLSRYDSIEFGAHTVTHLDMSACSPEIVAKELSEAKASIERATDRPVRFFAYPYSRVGSGDEVRVANAGYQAGFAGDEATRVHHLCNRYRIPRVDAPRSVGKLALITSGAFPEISLDIFGHA